MAYYERWIASSGQLLRPGRLSRSLSSRSSLIYGTYKPSVATAGTLTPRADLLDGTHNYNSPSTVSVTIADGAVITSKVIYGKVTHAGSALITDCILMGSPNALTSGNDAVVLCTNTRTGIAVYKDCEVFPQVESPGRNCFLGWQYEAERVWGHGGEDIFGVYNTTAAANNVKIKGCLIEDMAYSYPDRDHADGSHSDGIQVQGGTNTDIIGNAIWGTAHYMLGSSTYYNVAGNNVNDLGDWTLLKSPAQNPGAGLILSWASASGVVAPVDSTVVVDSNYFHHTKAQLLIKNTANNFVCTNNKFSTTYAPVANVNGTVHNSVALNFTHNPYWIRFDNIVTSGNVSGLTSGGAIVNTTNKWMDGGSSGTALTSPRASGIQNDGT